MTDIINVSSNSQKPIFCDSCGKRLESSEGLKAKCVVCNNVMCSNCLKQHKGKYYCPKDLPPPPKNKDCFIATSAYGTPMAQEIDILRKWRDESLITSPAGTIFINTYYKTSPPIANIISKSDNMRSVTRFLLKPLIIHFNNRFKQKRK